MTGAGRVLQGRYRLLEPLGRGGQASVWLAEDRMLGRQVAIKELAPARAAGDETEERQRGRALYEAQALARIDHPCVVAIHDVFVDERDPWLVMELVQGRPLDALITEGPLAEREAARIGRSVLAGLEAAHAGRVLHRDVKPSNIMVGPGDRVRLVDFGIARVDGLRPLTVTGQIVGTLAYLAPERLGLDPPGPASDLWSLGVTLYEALEGRSPIMDGTGAEPAAVLHAILHAPIRAPARPGSLAAAVGRLLVRDPAARMPAAELRAALDRVLDPPPPPRKPPREPPRKPPPPPGGASVGKAPSGVEEMARMLPGITPQRAAELLAAMDARAAARVLARVGPAVGGPVLAALPREPAARVLARLEPRDGAALLDGPARTAELLSMLTADQAGRLALHLGARRTAEVVAVMPPGEAARVVAGAGSRDAAGILVALPVATAAALVGELAPRRAGKVLDYVPPPTIAAIVGAIPGGRSRRLLDALAPSVRGAVESHL